MQASAAESGVVEAAVASGRTAVSDGRAGAPDLARIDLTGRRGSAQARRGRSGAGRGNGVHRSNLPPLPAGRVYQVWVVTGQASMSAGLMTPDAAGGE